MFKCYIKILTDTYIDNLTDIAFFPFVLCYSCFFFLFALLIVSGA